MHVVSTDFTDDQLLDQPAIMLEHKTDDEIAQIGRVFIPMLSSGFSPQGAAAFLLLAYNLKNNAAGADHAIPEEDEAANVKDMNYTELSSTILEHVTARSCAKNDIAPRVNVEEEARVYTFIAASTLRLFAKPYENYLNAWSHILNGYQRFYGHTIKIPVPQPTATALRSLTHLYTTSPLYKWTLYRILYSGGGTKDAADLKNFLYEIYLANTGLHIVNIFLRLCVALNCSSTDVIAAIYSPEFEKTLSALTKMINLVVKEDDSHKRKMWRYGRLFDETFMAPLRTKSCPGLTFILAAALKSVSPQTNKDILNIAQLRDVSAEKRKECIEVGELLVKYVKDKQKDQVEAD